MHSLKCGSICLLAIVACLILYQHSSGLLTPFSQALPTGKDDSGSIVSAARSLTCRDDPDSKWRLLLAENELSRVSLLSRISIGN